MSNTQLVWDGLLEADRLHRYYGYLADKFEKREKRLSWICAVSSSTAAASMVADYPLWIVKCVVFLVAAINIYLILEKFQQKSFLSASRQQRFGDLQIEWEALWAGLYSLEDDVIRQRWQELSRRANEIAGNAADLPLDQHIRKLSRQEAYHVQEARYSPSSI